MSSAIPSENVRLHSAFSHARVFAGLDSSELAEIGASFRSRTYARGSKLFLQGQPAAVYYLVGEGQVKVLQTSSDGFDVILHIFGPGELIGALPMLGEGTYPGTAVGLTEVVAFSISSEDFEVILKRFPAVTVNLLHFAAGIIQASHARLRELATERVERRIARAIARLASQTGVKTEEGITLSVPLSRQDLAELTGTTLFTVSRTLKAWERKGIVRASRASLTVLHPHALIAIGEDLPDRPPAS
jgi:CRP-like cAMP-binding protein